MGLDMCLMQNILIKPETEVYIQKQLCKGVTRLQREIAYWRKANHIHRWFVHNVQNGEDDCGKYNVSSEQLMELYQLCEDLLKDKNTDKAKELLPTVEGFFFGGTEYGEMYWAHVKATTEMLAPIISNQVAKLMTPLKEHIIYTYYQYHSSW